MATSAVGVRTRQTHLSALLRSLRSQLGLQQASVAVLAGVSPATLSDLERGRVTHPGIEILRRVAVVLEVPVADLLAAAVRDADDDALGGDAA